MTTIIRGIGGLFRGKGEVSAPEGTSEEVKSEIGQPKQPALTASQDTITAILNPGKDGKIRDDLRTLLITGLKNSLVKDKKFQEALVKDFGEQTNNKRDIQIAIDILDLGIPFSVQQLPSSRNSNQSLKNHLNLSPEKKVQPVDLWSKISDQSLKVILEHANTVINAELKKQSNGSITEDLNLFKRDIDMLEDKINSANRSQSTNSKKLLTFGNAVKLGIVGLVAGTVTELTGVTDFTPLGPNKGATPPPAQVVGGDVMKAITNFSGKDMSSEAEDSIQNKIDTNLNLAKAGDPSLTLTPSAYYGNTLEPLSISGQNQGSKVQANIKLNPNDEDKPFLLIYQEGRTSIQITAVPLDAAKAEPLKQPANSEVTVITLPAGGKPSIKTEKADLTSLLKTPAQP